MSKKSGYAKYSFAFASDIQSLADEKHIKVVNFNVQKRKNHFGSYDYLTVNFIVPRPDRDQDDQHENKSFDEVIHEIEESVEALDQTDLEKENEVIINDL